MRAKLAAHVAAATDAIGNVAASTMALLRLAYFGSIELPSTDAIRKLLRPNDYPGPEAIAIASSLPISPVRVRTLLDRGMTEHEVRVHVDFALRMGLEP